MQYSKLLETITINIGAALSGVAAGSCYDVIMSHPMDKSNAKFILGLAVAHFLSLILNMVVSYLEHKGVIK